MKIKNGSHPVVTGLGYSSDHARSGVGAGLPKLEAFPNQYRGYEIETVIPEFTSICPKTGLPDFGTLTIRYMPKGSCLELKSLKQYILGFRNMGIFYENVVNRVLDDVAAAAKPAWVEVKGQFSTRGGMHTTVTARWPRRTGR